MPAAELCWERLKKKVNASGLMLMLVKMSERMCVVCFQAQSPVLTGHICIEILLVLLLLLSAWVNSSINV